MRTNWNSSIYSNMFSERGGRGCLHTLMLKRCRLIQLFKIMQPYVVLRVHLSKNLSENTCYGLLLRSWKGLMRVRAEWTTTLIWFTLWSSGLETFLKSQSKISIWIYQNGRFSWSTTCLKKSRRLMIYCFDSLRVHLQRLHIIKVIWTPVYLYV